jgi:tetratricopeptide (TPR) repeat protein
MALAAALTAPPAMAFDESQRGAYDAAFDAMQADPGNSNKALAYAQAAIKYGDLEGAVGALERLLIIDPNLPRVRLELGVLYYKLQSYALAHTYLDKVLEARDLPPDVSDQAKKYLSDIDAQSSPFRISAVVQTGLRWQSDANAAPSLDELGIGQPIGSLGGKTSDWNLFGTLSVNAVYDFQRPDGLALESNLNVYGQKQFKERLSALDLWIAQFDTGPRINLHLGDMGLTVRPYALFDYLMLQQSEYFHSGGGGVSASLQISPDWSANGSFEIKQRNYHSDDIKFSLADDRTGAVYTVSGDLRYALSQSQLLALAASVERTDAKNPGQATLVYAFGPAYVARFAVPGISVNLPVTTTVSVQRLWRQYDQPYTSSPFIFDTEADRQWLLSASANFQVTDRIGAQLQLQQYWVDSNIPTSKYDNTAISTSVSYAF